MNSLIRIRTLALALWLAGPALASADIVTLWNSGFANSGVIPDGRLSGWSDVRTVSDVVGSISSLSVTLNLSGGCNGDLYAYLAHDTGYTVLLNRVGRGTGNALGYEDSGMNVTLTAGGSDIHNYQSGAYTLTAGQLTGIWAPDGRAISPLAPVGTFDTAGRTTFLSSFTGLNPNGSWTLFVADVSGGEQTTLTSWGLNIASVPELASLAGGAVAVLFLGGAIGLYRKKKASSAAKM